MKDLIIVVLMVAVVSAIMWWRRRGHLDLETEARRCGLIGGPSPRRAVVQLARVEARLLQVHPATLIGFALMMATRAHGGLQHRTHGLGDPRGRRALACVVFAWGR